MRIHTTKEAFLPALLAVNGVIEKSQTMSILSHSLLCANEEGVLSLTATDNSIEVITHCHCEVLVPGCVTLPAQKLLDICKNFPPETNIEIHCEDGKVGILKANRGRYRLQALPAESFPNLEQVDYPLKFSLQQNQLRNLFNRTKFSMGINDIRTYLNGLCLEVSPGRLRAISTDGHRLSLSHIHADIPSRDVGQFILPRKAVQEIFRILKDDETIIHCQFSKDHLSFSLPNITITSKLLDGKFANYQRVIPDIAFADFQVILDRSLLLQTLTRIATLSQEKIKRVCLDFIPGTTDDTPSTLTLQFTHENEEAKEIFDIDYQGEAFKISFNAIYATEFLSIPETQTVNLYAFENDSSVFQDPESEDHLYVVMPMHI